MESECEAWLIPSLFSVPPFENILPSLARFPFLTNYTIKYRATGLAKVDGHAILFMGKGSICDNV